LRLFLFYEATPLKTARRSLAGGEKVLDGKAEPFRTNLAAEPPLSNSCYFMVKRDFRVKAANDNG
jgi:hypothetical protein